VTNHLRTKVALTAGTALLGAVALAGTAHAADVSATAVYGGYDSATATSYGANGAVRVCDVHADGYAAATHYVRVNGSSGRLAVGGNGKCAETTDIRSNPIAYFNACVTVSGSDYCTAYISTGR
jgi:hypothetical protein